MGSPDHSDLLQGEVVCSLSSHVNLHLLYLPALWGGEGVGRFLLGGFLVQVWVFVPGWILLALAKTLSLSLAMSLSLSLCCSLSSLLALSICAP